MPSMRPSRSSICLFVPLILIASGAAYGQQPDDQPASPVALNLFTSAWNSECQVLKENSPLIADCGSDLLIRNQNLQAWGFSTPLAGLHTDTRYNPDKLMQINAAFGDSALFFVFAHESGHHFDLQFHQPSVPWHLTLPPLPEIPAPMIASWNNELRADAWGGCAVKMTGGNLESVEHLQTITANINDNPDVPPFQYAQEAIKAGYDACQTPAAIGQVSTPTHHYDFGILAKHPQSDKDEEEDDETIKGLGCFGILCKN
jgi:hypothetical protein